MKEDIPKVIWTKPTINDEIVERLNKQIKWFVQHQKDDPDQESQDMLNVLQKILTGKEDG